MLEQKLKQNADAIFGGNLPKGHRERFADKLDARRKSKKAPVFRLIYGGLAIAACLLTAIFIADRYTQAPSDRNDEPFDEVRNYYSSLLDSEFEQTWQQAYSLDVNSREALYRDMINLRAETDILSDIEDSNNTLTVMVYTSKIATLRHIREIINE